ncbi:MAG: hypothetical protein OEZ23_04280 [Gammaproteobacteria bacterium]|nr:hypothetical protein [Gammaproteobacteria bacterium]
MAQDEDQIEVFKQAVTATMRAISGNDELLVSFGRGKPYIQGNRARIPLPEKGISETELAALRGNSDRIALEQRFHDDSLHQKNRPESGIAQELYDCVERARVAAIGGYLMKGVGENLNAQLEQYAQLSNFHTFLDPESAPLGEAVGLYVREKLTGEPLPPSARHLLDLWRGYIEEKVGNDLDGMEDQLFDQSGFVDITRRLIRDLGLSDQWGDQSNESDSEDQDPEEQEMESEAGDEASEQEMEGESDVSDAIEGDVAMDMDAMELAEMEAEADEAGAPPDMELPKNWMRPRETDYKVFTTAFDDSDGR